MLTNRMCNLLDWQFLTVYLTVFCGLINASLRPSDVFLALPPVYLQNSDGKYKANHLSKQFRKRTYFALPSVYLTNIHRNGLDYEIDLEKKPDLEPTSEEVPFYKNRKYGEHLVHPTYHTYHHNDYHHHHIPPPLPVRHLTHSKHLYLPIPIQHSTGTKKHDFSVWIWPLVFIIILPLVLGAILLPLALVFLMNLIFLLFTMRNNNAIGVLPGGYKDSGKQGRVSEKAMNNLFAMLEKAHEKYNTDKKINFL